MKKGGGGSPASSFLFSSIARPIGTQFYEVFIMTQVAYRPTEIDFDEDGSHRHWCPQSEKFTTGDALRSALDEGWKIHGVVFEQEHWHNNRRVLLNHLKLQQDGQRVTMVVVQNPYIVRLLNELCVQVVKINQRKTVANERW
jgi:hypothetical protein